MPLDIVAPLGSWETLDPEVSRFEKHIPWCGVGQWRHAAQGSMLATLSPLGVVLLPREAPRGFRGPGGSPATHRLSLHDSRHRHGHRSGQIHIYSVLE